MDEDTPLTTNKLLNEWTPSGLKKSGFNEEGERTDESVKEAGQPQFHLSPEFDQWLKDTGGSFVLSTYQSGRIIFLGLNEDNTPYFLDRAVGTAMGLAIDQNKLWVAARDQVWRFSNIGANYISDKDYQAVYMPRSGFMIGNSNAHDAVADVSFQGKHYDFLYANTQYSCIAAPDDHYSFVPVWKPDFISGLAAEDRCHLNGMCSRDGELRYVTICGRNDTPLGWKNKQTGTGFIIDLETEEVVCEGLSMPHSPRWHRGKLWVLNSGEGELGYVDFETKRLVVVSHCTGFARGLCFVDNMAVVGLSRLRPKSMDLPGINLATRLNERKTPQRTGMQVFNIETGSLAHWITESGPITELYDVAFLPEISRPYSPGFRNPELHRDLINIPG